MPDPTHTTPDQTLPEIPEGIQRYLWEADQLTYEPSGSGPTEHGAHLLAPLGEYIAVRDLPALYAAHRKQVLIEYGSVVARLREERGKLEAQVERACAERDMARKQVEAEVRKTLRDIIKKQETGVLAIAERCKEDDEPVRAQRLEDEAAVLRNIIALAALDTLEADR